jgi:hypothetical protein
VVHEDSGGRRTDGGRDLEEGVDGDDGCVVRLFKDSVFNVLTISEEQGEQSRAEEIHLIVVVVGVVLEDAGVHRHAQLLDESGPQSDFKKSVDLLREALHTIERQLFC